MSHPLQLLLLAGVGFERVARWAQPLGVSQGLLAIVLAAPSSTPGSQGAWAALRRACSASEEASPCESAG
jgi:hypothetical protein